MKRTMLGALTCIGLVWMLGFAGDRSDGFEQRSAPAAVATPGPMPSPPTAVAGSELIVVPTTAGDRGQMLTVIDPRNRVLSVYHIDLTGKIELRSVRNISWDLKMMFLNNADPLPQAIQSLLEQK